MPLYTTKVTDHPGSTAEEIAAESASGSRHRFGNTNAEGRRAGYAGWHDYDREHDVDELYEGRQDYEQFARKHGRDGEKGHPRLTVRDVMARQVDWKQLHPDLHIDSRFVLNVTEDEIKNDEGWQANKKKKEAEEKKKREEQQNEQQSSSDESDTTKVGKDDGKEGKKGKSEDKQADAKAESEKKDKHDSKKPTEKGEDEAKDQEFKRNRAKGDDERAHPAHPEHEEEDDADTDLSRAERHFLEHLQKESKHMAELQPTLGDGHSPFHGQKYQEIEVDEADQNTPDNWIPRSKQLLRQTGQHPLNGEPKIGDLFDAGLVTPTPLHYVRNHGAVPRLNFETHRVLVSLLDDIEPEGGAELGEAGPDGGRLLKMKDIMSLPSINIPVTIACDGNRRKEINMVRRSKGFNWGPGAVSNAYWKGAPLHEVLKATGCLPKKVTNARLFVHFEGADQLTEGRYATSIPLEQAIDPCNDVMLAYEINDQPLAPDHGYPLRVILPGYVGGRNVKWLEKVWISTKPNDSHFHIWDNRVLPEFVTEKDGPFAETMFHHPDTACMEQNLNSVIVKPEADHRIVLTGDHVKPGKTFRIEGYAYDGGGHLVQKVEVSLDGGKTWLYAFRRFPDNALRHGWKFWTWCHWYCDVQMSALLGATEICVRAWNVFKNTQPDQITPNLLGMMNNAVYRVRPRIRQVKGDTVLTFEHPVSQGPDGSGWMKPAITDQLKAAEQAAASPAKQFTRDEVEKHNKEGDAWIVVNDKVYDATSVLEWHPGGAHAILGVAGKCDATVSEQYNSIHDDYANHKLQEVCIGAVTDKAKKAMKEQRERRAKEEQEQDPSFALQKHRWTPVTLKKKEELSDSSCRYTFAFPDASQKLNLPPGRHLLLGVHFRDKMVFRSYTPTRPVLPEEEDGTFDLVIKTYYPSERDPGGTLSNVLDCMREGEQCDVRGPTGEISYVGDGKFDIEGEERHFDTLNLVAGGTGITPHYQLICRILKTEGDKTKINLVYANRSEDDILLREDLEALQDDRFKLVHVLSKPSDDWQGEKGHAGKEQFQKYFAQGDKAACFMCGPPPLVKAAHEALGDMGFEDEKTLFAF